MKLYATVTSDRAKKGQGGNSFLHIEIYGENQNVPVADAIVSSCVHKKPCHTPRLLIDVRKTKNAKVRVYDLIETKNSLIEKGKKGKSESDECKRCGASDKDGYESLCYDCQMKS